VATSKNDNLKLFLIRWVLKSVWGYRCILYCDIPVRGQLKNTFTFETCILMVRLLHLSTDSLCCWKYVDEIHLVCIVFSCLVSIVVICVVCIVVSCLVCIVVVYCCSCLVCIVVNCVVCIVVVVFVYCCSCVVCVVSRVVCIIVVVFCVLL